MPTTTRHPTLTAVKDRRTEKRAADLALVTSVVDWAVEHQDTDPGGPDPDDFLGPCALALAGEGAPRVEDFALYELAATLGRTIESTCSWVGEILEVRYRLPRCWERVASGELAPYRAFEIAQHTKTLNRLGVDYVDRHLAPVAGTLSRAQLDRTVRHALIAFDPAEADRRAAAAAEHRHVTIDLGHLVDGHVQVQAVLDAADALDLEHAVRAAATQLGQLGSTETLDVRRSQALGEIARAQLALDLSPAEGDKQAAGRGVTLHLHLDPATGAVDLDHPGTAGTAGTTTLGQLRSWCQTAGTTVTVLPVVDLNETRETASYTPTTKIRQHVELRDRHCVAPYCTRPARSCDLDHITPHATGGATSTDNLAPLCRRHHRAKTHHPGWTYAMTHPGTYDWTLPAGDHYRVDHQGTHPA